MNGSKFPSVSIYFLIAGLENKYLFLKTALLKAHELMSQKGSELMSSALTFTLINPFNAQATFVHSIKTQRFLKTI